MSAEPLYSTSAIPEIQHHSYPHSHPHPHHPTDLIDSFSETDSDDQQDYPSLISCAIAGGVGGMVGDTSMHSLDTVKTRQQGAPQILKYKNTFRAYKNIFIEEGIRKGLYGGYNAAMLGSFPSSAVFFFTYEYVKRLGIDEYDMNETLTFLGAGFVGDFVSSIFYVPSEVLKTRLQLQGRHNNPHFKSGYNYFNTFNAVTTIIKTEGWKTLFFGYKATLIRDLPFSALQFTFYEKFRLWAYDITGTNKSKDNLPLVAELVTGAGAGGLAGMITTPLDVVKTRMQTQNGNSGNVILSSSSTIKNLSTIYSSQGTLGLFSGVGPRFVWTSIQSSVMLLLYQVCLRALNTGEVTLE